MAGRWSDRTETAFRADPDAAPAAQPSRRQALALLSVLLVVAGAVAVASYLVRPEKARAFDLFHGSLFLSDQHSPVAVDLPSGKPTLQLFDASKQVGLDNTDHLGVVPLTDRTLLLNEVTGEFNMVDNSGFVVKRDGGGVPLVKRAGITSALGVAADNGQAYIVRTGFAGGTDVYLVSQSTVESAVSATGSVHPRASGSIAGPGPTDATAAASANGDLWLLTGQAQGLRTIRQLHVPGGSSAGAALVQSAHGRVNGAAAIGTATERDGSGGAVVGVASVSRIDLFTPGSGRQTVTYTSPPGVTTILPVSNQQGRLAFFLRGSAGWYLTSIDADGTDAQPPKLVEGLPNDALAPPAFSNGLMYTIDQSNGDLYQVGLDAIAKPLAGRATYPRADIESADFTDSYVIARGPRVIYNSETHNDALVVFTDGSHAPRTIVKSDAVQVDAASGAEALTKSTVPPGHVTKPRGGEPKPAAVVQPINPKIDCKTAKQKPHIPLITSAVPGSRTVALTWDYLTLTPQDCYPSTYVVAVRLISNDAPPAPGDVRVQAQTGATIGGLFPSTQYEVTVTAYINGLGTESEPVRITTGPEGPQAPSDLSVTAGASGDWRLTWKSCGTVQQGCVPAQSWTIVPSFCDGRGLSSPPPPMSVTADPTSTRQPPATYKGTDELLGRGLRFTVQGTGAQGQAGSPSERSPCVYSWSAPIASAMTLQASTAAVQQLGEPTTATVHLDLGPDPVRATGGVGATFTYELLGADGSVLNTIGPTTRTTVRFDGIRAGISYQARAVVAPPRHETPVAVVGPIDVETAHAPWPTITVTADPPVDQGPLRSTVTVHIGGLTSADANNELFDMTNDSGIYCGNANEIGGWDQMLAIDPADPRTFTVDRTELFGADCVVKIQLVQNEASGTSVFGAGTASNTATSAPFTISAPDLVGVSAQDFVARWAGDLSVDGRSQIAVTYTGSNPLIGLFVHSWSVAVTDPDGTACGGYQDRNSLDEVPVSQACVDANGASGSNWDVQVSFKYFGAPQGPYDVTPVEGGAAPTYNPPQCDVGAATVTAGWGGTMATPVVSLSVAHPAELAGCSGWTYAVAGPTDTSCGGNASGNPPPTNIAVVGCDDAPSAGWTVTVGYTDTDGTQKSASIAVEGDLPP